MVSPIKQIVSDGQGWLCALHADGTIARQRKADGLTEAGEWIAVPIVEIIGRVAQIAVRQHSNTIVAMTGDGTLWEQFRTYNDKFGYFRWRPLEGPVAP